MPAARQLSERVSPLDSYELPTGIFADGTIPVRRFEGRVERKTFRINGASATTLQLLTPLREQLESMGYDLIYQCEDRTCGGFDFRFGTEVVPAPDMHVDIRNYRFLSAVLEPDTAISVLVSRSGSAAYIQIIRVSPSDAQNSIQATTPEASVATTEDLALALQRDGHVVLRDLEFDSGAGALLPGPHETLDQLAKYLSDHPDQRIALVGHTDSTGALATNIALSKRRAAAVRTRLIDSLDVDPSRIDAEGNGYLAPVASNLTPQGREANRRVEAILLPAR
ncbi:OmpA family protein [Sedimentitalea todarodis]|uniref:OmpA family protein n=1 Tax=Sedimentitalea todarodis TaxID=1631240 RepID=A0ABU3VAK1_9RHOB|nr:OmpA family protein [Sedimentitalea todarodis]MDU9003070.1 OmpA family protein [Sedimentitalea todarodis]